MKAIKLHVISVLKGRVEFPEDRFVGLFKTPDSIERGDLALPCFPFAKQLGKKPNEIAEEFCSLFTGDSVFEKVEAVGPFLNFTYDSSNLASRVLEGVFASGDDWGNSDSGQGKTVVIDFSSPNIAKPIAFHHIRSTVIGNSIGRLHASQGWKVVGINYLGDWGTQFGKLIVAYNRWGSEEDLRKDEIRHLLEIYVRFHKQVEKEPELEQQARDWFKRMEKGDEEALSLWRLFYNISLKEFRRVYATLGIEFTHFEGESFYRERLDDTVELVGETAGISQSQGATVVDLEAEGLPPCLLRKSDGATLYATRDIAAAIDRHERFEFDRALYVVANQQSVYFKQLFLVLGKMGFDWAGRMTHIGFGMLGLKDKTMSTRKGEVIFLEDVLSRAIELSHEAIERKNSDLENKEDVARMVGVGAIVFGDLINRRTNDVTFEWERILNFQGETGVYVQYTYARARSMLRKAGDPDTSVFDRDSLGSIEEKLVLKLIGQFPDRVEQATESFDPSLVAKSLIDLCRAFNKLYNIDGYRFLEDDADLRLARLALVRATTVTLKRGLYLLGIETPEQM